MPTIALAQGGNATDEYQCNSTADINLNGDKYGLRPVDLPINKFWVPNNIYTWNMSTQPLYYTGASIVKCMLQCVTVWAPIRLLRKRNHAGRSNISNPHVRLSFQRTLLVTSSCICQHAFTGVLDVQRRHL